MDVLRTPDERFADLPGYPFEPNYVDVDAGDGSGDRLRVHVVDEGLRDAAETVLMLHGEPSWSYLYRTMIPMFAAEGHRAVAPDLVGFGRSDKPASRADYTYQRHLDWLREVVLDRLDLRDITLVCHDWGGLLGLRLVAEHPDRFRRVVAANTFLPTGDRPVGEAFLRWRDFSQRVAELPIGLIIQGATMSVLPDNVVAAYDAPFPDESFKEGARQFPILVPVGPDDLAAESNRRAWESLAQFDRPFLCAFGDSDSRLRRRRRRPDRPDPWRRRTVPPHPRRRGALPPRGCWPGARGRHARADRRNALSTAVRDTQRLSLAVRFGPHSGRGRRS